MAQVPIHRYVPTGAVKVADKASDALVYVYDRPGAKGGVILYAIAYHGKASKPDWHFRFASAEAREKRVKAHFAAHQAWAAHKVKRAALKAEQRAKGHKLQVGHILVCSWGYEQTNIDWYKVLALVGKNSVQIAKIGALNVESLAWAQGKSVPDIDGAHGEPMVKRVTDSETVKIESYAHAHLWDGKPRHWTAYA